MWRLVLLSFYNVKSKPKFSFQIVLSLTIIMSIISLISILNIGISNFYSNLVSTKAYDNSISFNASVSKKGYIKEQDEIVLAQLNTMKHINRPAISTKLDIPLISGNEEYSFIKLDRVTVNILGLEYIGNNDLSNDFRTAKGQNVLFEADVYLTEGDVITEANYKMFDYYYPNQNVIIEGDIMHNTGDIMITDYMLKQFGIKDFTDLIGEKIQFYIDGNPFMKPMRITGVLNSNYFRISSHNDLSQIIIYCDRNEISYYDINEFKVFAPIDSFDNGAAVFNELRTLGYDNIVDFNEYLAKQYFYIVRIKVIVSYILNYVAIFIALAMFINLYNNINIHILNNIRYYGIMRAMGIQRTGLHIILNSELLIINTISSLLSFVVSAVLFHIINYVGNQVDGGSIEICVKQYLIMFSITSVAVFSIIKTMADIILLKTQNSKITELLRN